VTLNPSGYAKVSLPNVIQITRRSAIAKLSSVGLNVVDVEYIPEIGKEMVYHVKQNGRRIPPGTLIQKASDVVLVCGNGQR
jgi:beta-lactam-binding protein with PASTA domain